MEINKENYEVYFLDYFENRLSPGQVAELMVFLEENQEFKKEFDQFENLQLPADNQLKADFKKRLKKKDYKSFASVDSWNYEEQMVAYLEGDLDEEDTQSIKGFIRANPEASLELDLFRKTFLTAPTIPYPEMENLKKKVAAIVLWPWGYATAALILLLMGWSFFFNNAIPERTTQLEAIAINAAPELPATQATPDRINMREAFVSFKTNQSIVTEISRVVKVDPLAKIIKSGDKIEFETEAVAFAALDARSDFGPIILNLDLENERSFAARFIKNVFNKALGNPQPQNKSLLEYTVEGYNFMADREVAIDRVYDNDGQLIGYDLNGGFIAFNQRGKE